MKRNDPMKFEFDDADGENEEGTIESVNREILKLTGMLQGNKDRLSAEAISARDRADDAETMYKKMLKQLREEMSMEREKWAKERRRLTMSLQGNWKHRSVFEFGVSHLGRCTRQQFCIADMTIVR